MASENVEMLALCLICSNKVLEDANIWLCFRLWELSSSLFSPDFSAAEYPVYKQITAMAPKFNLSLIQ